MSKWVQMRQAQLAKETANNTREMLRVQQEQQAHAQTAAPASGERIAHLEARVATLEGRLEELRDLLIQSLRQPPSQP